MKKYFSLLAGLAVLIGGVSSTRAQNGTWAVDADGNWSGTGNWSGGIVADGTDSTAFFTNNITANRTVTLDSNRTIGNITFSDNGGLGSAWTVNNGANTLTLSNASGASVFNVNTNATVSGLLAGTGGLIKNGAGQLSLTTGSGVSSTFTGGFTVNGGTLRIAGGGTSAPVTSQAVVLNNGTFMWDNLGGAANKTFNMTTLTASSGDNVVISQRASGINTTLNFTGGISRSTGATVTLQTRDAAGAPTTPISGGNVLFSVGTGASTQSTSGVFTTLTGGATEFAIWNTSGPGQLRAPTYNTTANFVDTSSGGSLTSGAATNNRVTTSISGQASASTRTLKLQGASAVNLGMANGAALDIALGNILTDGGSAKSITGTNATITTGSNVEYIINTANAADTLTVNVAITANGTNALTKAGNGTLILGGVNTYTGNTYVNSGTLSLADDAQLQFVIGASGVNNRITGLGTLSLSGDLAFDLSGAGTTVGDSWNIVDVGTLTETFGSSFSVAGFTDAGSGLWTSGIYQFNETTGVLSVAVPEPSTYGLLLGGMGLLVLLRRKMARGPQAGEI